MKHLISAILVFITFSAYSNPASVKFADAGFSIDILDAKPNNFNSQPLSMTLPPVKGFSANVIVQIQPFTGTVEEYLELSEKQFQSMGLKVISNKTNGNEVLLEYKGNLLKRDLHFYAKAVKKDKIFYLITATDLESEWEKTSVKLKSVVDSFVTE